MTTYVYLVKCPNCEDEFFDFFDEAKEYALGCLSNKPIITQTEVERNDFGECTDHCDLGTVWSWEDMMKDTATDAEPAKVIFTKDDLKDYIPDEDPEFQDDDFFAIDNEDSSSTISGDLDNFDKPEPVTEWVDAKGNKVIIGRSGATRQAAKSQDTGTTNTGKSVASALKALNNSDFQNRNGNYPRSGVPDTIYASDTDISFSFKNTSQSAAERWVRSYLSQNGFTVAPENVKSYQPGDYDDDWVDVSVNIKNISFTSNESCERQPIPEGMTIEQLVEEMEENEDTVECTWCNDLFDKSECRKEVDLGWLCSRCEAAIKSRGETLTFKENNYWDFLDEDTSAGKKTWICYLNGQDVGTVEAATEEEAYREMEKSWSINNEDAQVVPVDELEESISDEYDLTTLVKDSIYHLTNDLGKDPWVDDFADDVIGDIERNYENYVPSDFDKYQEWCSAVACEVSRQVNNSKHTSFLEELEESEDYRKRLTLCPECGDEHAYDKETGFCLNCGFSI